MKKIIVILGCAAILLSACGKKQEQSDAAKQQEQVQNQEQFSDFPAEAEDGSAIVNTADNEFGDEENLPPTKYFEDELTRKIAGDSHNLEVEFAKLSDAQKYHFCAAFAMGAMSAAKPITASVMVTYFMGLGVAKYNVGIDDKTYVAFNAGKNVFFHENLVNTILENKSCENIINDATDYAVKEKISVADLDELGQVEVEKVVEYIKAEE